jgi:hypothetical protein
MALNISMNKNSLIYRVAGGLLYFVLSLLFVLAPLSLSFTSHDVSLNAAYAQTSTASTCSVTDITSCFKEFIWTPIKDAADSGVRTLMTSIASIFIGLSVLLLQLASGLFDTLVRYTIISFGDTNGLLNPGVIQAINVAWSAFRDLSNILIVGFFTFIAINIILGSPTFGQKRLIANVLIVAILINFSLLFTKIIIDFSNYTATQFYIASISRPATTGGSASTSTPDGIADRFLRAAKVTSFASTYDSIGRVGEQEGKLFLFTYALVIFALITGAAMVLFYGSFILISRAILLIFLMVTAALAFTTYLMPSNSPLNQWGTWWRSLIQSAVLAPVLIIFLWATLRVSESLRSTGTLGDLVNSPNNASNLGALFSYIIILSLLFATFKIASSFSMSIAGFNWASVVPAVTLAGGSRFAASLARGTSFAAGQGLSAVGNRLSTNRNQRLATLGGGLLNTGKGLNTLSTKQLNLMNTPAGALAARQTGGITSQKALAGAPRAPIGTSAASQRAAKAITDALKNKNKGVTGPTGAAIAKAPPTPPTTPPGGASALPRPGAAALPAPKPPVPTGTTPPAGAHMATTDESTKVAAINDAAKTRQEAATATAEALKENNKAVTEQIKEAAGGGAANDNTLKAMKEQSEQNRTAMKEMATELKEASAQSSEKIGAELGKAASGIKEATTTTGKALTESVQGVQEMAKRATEIQTKAIEKQEDRDELNRNAAIEHGKSEGRSRDYEAIKRTESAAAKAQEATRVQHFADIKNKFSPANDNFANDNISPANQASSGGPMSASTPATARFAAQPYTQAAVSQTAPGIPLHQDTADAETLLKEIRANRERAAQLRRNQFKLVDGGKNDQAN